MTTSVIVVSDLHIGSTVALSLDRFTRDDGETVYANKTQLWLRECWKDFWDTVLERTKGTRRVLVLNGDLVDGPGHHGTYQSVSYNPADEVRHAVELLKPIREHVDLCFITRGTEAHVGGGSSQEEMIAYHLDVVADSHRLTWDVLPLEVENVLFNFAHHGRVSNSLTAASNAAAKAASEHFHRAKRLGRRPADLLVYSHAHRWADSGTTYDTRTIQTPCWQATTGWANRYFPDELNFADVGGVLFSCDDSEYDVKWIGRDRYLVQGKPVCQVTSTGRSPLTVKRSSTPSTKLSA
jgi:hypothetical protein